MSILTPLLAAFPTETPLNLSFDRGSQRAAGIKLEMCGEGSYDMMEGFYLKKTLCDRLGSTVLFGQRPPIHRHRVGIMIRRTNEMKRIAILMPDNDVAATIMLEVRVFRLDSAFGSLAWARPGAIIRESSGEKMVWPFRI
jgi:hypothetical protein